jgi:hypothetical protein
VPYAGGWEKRKIIGVHSGDKSGAHTVMEIAELSKCGARNAGNKGKDFYHYTYKRKWREQDTFVTLRLLFSL